MILGGTLVYVLWHRRAIPIFHWGLYLSNRAVLGEGCPGVRGLERVGTPVKF